MKFLWSAPLVLVLSLLVCIPAQAEKLKFNRDIRPILSEKCFLCHGPDVAGNKSDMRLDVREIAIEYLKDGSVLDRINHADPDERMPPLKSNRSLDAKERATIAQWIEEGAEYEAHWAYEQPEKAEVPKGVHPVDHFINAGLDSKSIKSSSAADRRTLTRRLHLDLLGLPPKAADVEAFVGNPSADAWKTVVQQTLKSPHFGERLAVYWLDLVRYADTVGFHGDQNMAVAPYRDYVIRSFNNNLPFDQFTREQIAGDLLEEPTMWQQVATAYNRLNKKTNEGGAQDLEYRVKNAADRVRATSTVWMGATLGCAECHDHKFDPFSQKDFYQFAAFFADIEENGFYGRNGHKDGIWGSYLKVPRAGDDAKIAALDKEIGGYKNEIAGKPEGFDAGLKEMVANLKKQIEGTTSMWTVADLPDLKSTGGATMKKQGDGSYLASGKNPDKDDYNFTLKPGEAGITGFLLESLVDKTMSKGANSRGNGNIVVSYIDVRDAKGDPVKIIEAKADFEQNGWPVKGVLNPAAGWAIDGHNHKKSRQAYFKFDRRLDAPFTISVQHRSEHARHVIGRLRISTTSNVELGFAGAKLPNDLAAAVTAEKPNKAQAQLLEKRYRETSSLFTEVRKGLLEAEKKKKSLVEGQATVLVTKRAATPREVRILNRGDWMDKSGELVTPGTPHFMKGQEVAEGTELSRLDLANWLASNENPLTARVFVNRLWQLMFGTGLSKVLDDIGSQGEPPTHPELLDWLAVEFMDSGWDVKHMVELLVTSEAYQRSSIARPDLAEVDPYNRLLARQSPFRVPAEFVRDNALSVSGLLNPQIGGATAKPYQPPGYYRELNFPGRKYAADMNENQYRRGVYTHWQRTFLHPMMKAFDAPDREECTAKRDISNTPTQSLVLLNDPSYVEAARALAERIINEGGSDLSAQMDWSFREVLARPVRVKEAELLSKLHAQQLKHYQENGKAAEELLSVGMRPVPGGVDKAKLAAMTAVARTLLNLHETITRY